MKVAIYCRLSEEDRNKKAVEDDSESIQNQKSMLVQYSIEHNWEIYNIYSDDDYTGSDRKRPEFNKLLEDASQHKFDIVLCKTQSRFTRELELVEKYIHGLFPLWNIRFLSIVDNADTDIKGNKKSRQINGLINEWYLEDISESIKSVFNAKRKEGYHIGSFALYGYKKDPEQKGHLIIDEEAAAVVREIFTLYSQGYGRTAIARQLNNRGIPNPSEYKRLQGLNYKRPEMKHSTLWKYTTILDMLTNEIYTGNMVQGKTGSVSYKTKQCRPRPKELWYIVENTHEPIIDKELWERVQALMKQNAKPYAGGTIGLFARKAKCKHCGYTMNARINHGKRYLGCSNRQMSKDFCIGSFIRVDRLEQSVLSELKKLSDEYLDKNELEQEIEFCNNLESQQKNLESQITIYQKKMEEYSNGIKTLYMDRIKGIISEGEYSDFSKDFQNSKQNLENLIADLEKQVSELEHQKQLGDNKKKIIEQYTNIEKLDRETVEKLIDCIYVDTKIPGTKQVPIEIHWNF